MSSRRLLDQAIKELACNTEQYEAVHELGHCVVRAGPGSGKTKTLTTAMARAVLEDVLPPRGIACITYNNECALELETRLAKLGIEPSDRVFIGTVHSFALSQIIAPYARCVLPELRANFRIANSDECNQAIHAAYHRLASGDGKIKTSRDCWSLAEKKRREQVDRTQELWRGRNPELADFVEYYEAELRRDGLIDFEDMPLLAFRMVQQHQWIRRSLHAKFPVLFVDEYQDLGHALHELVLMLCFDGGSRLFAVGDPDQSIYAFTGANPELFLGLAVRPDVRDIRLRFNYRCGRRIIKVSQAALGEERAYVAPDGAAEGDVFFVPVDGDMRDQADHTAKVLIPHIRSGGTKIEEIAVLYRVAEHGNFVAQAVTAEKLPIVRADNQALIRRNSRLCRFTEACARWVAGGWKLADPPFGRLAAEAVSLVFGPYVTDEARRQIELELISFLRSSIDGVHSAHSWLNAYYDALIIPWESRASTTSNEWEHVLTMIARTGPASPEGDVPLAHLGGYFEDSGRLNLSTLHSAKGREFDAVILFAMNDDILPTQRDQKKVQSLREARRLFYVGVTRARQQLYVVYRKRHHSPWVKELYDRLSST